MRRRGAIWCMRRERHPLVALAVLAIVMPALLAVGGVVAGHAAHRDIGVICTVDGAVGDQPTPGTHVHDGMGCCGVLCPHAAGLSGLAAVVQTAHPGSLLAVDFPERYLAHAPRFDRLHAIRGPPSARI